MLKKTAYKYFIIFFFFGVITFILFYFYTIQQANQRGFTAVFLTNNQVYFGKLASETETNLVLTNVYYLKADAGIQQGNEKKATAKISLVKLGEELHAPQDKMTINKSQVLFWEPMKEHGVIIDQIQAYEKKDSK